MRRGSAVLLAALVLVACGRRGAPVPPETRVPEPVSDLGAVVVEDGVALTWTNPGRRADGSRLRELGEVRLYRAGDDGTGEPRPALLSRGRVPGYREVAAVRPRPEAPPPAALLAGRPAQLTDRTALERGRRYTYVVVVEDPEGRAGRPSARATVTFVPPPAAPAGLTAAAGDGQVDLRWRAPERLADGTPLTGPLGYEVVRLAPEAEPVVIPVEAGRAELTDRGLDNDRTYHYTVRAVRLAAGTAARGPASPPVAATPRDMTPPSPPRDLVAIPSPGTVRLSWRPSPEPDVAVYVVYRAAAGGDFAAVGTAAAPAASFVDRGVRPGRWHYAVSARDGASRPNESARSEATEVTVP